MNWRPEGWNPDYTITILETADSGDLASYTNVIIKSAFEAGADAMLEALRTRSFLDMGTSDKLIIHGISAKPIKFVADCHGKLVLVPSDIEDSPPKE